MIGTRSSESDSTRLDSRKSFGAHWSIHLLSRVVSKFNSFVIRFLNISLWNLEIIDWKPCNLIQCRCYGAMYRRIAHINLYLHF